MEQDTHRNNLSAAIPIGQWARSELLVASNSDWQIRVGKERSSDGVDDFGKRLGQVGQLVNCDIVSPS